MYNVLVVDDSGVTRFTVKQMLKGTDYKVFEAKDGKHVLQSTFSKEVSLKDINLVLLDIHMGEVDGFEVLERISGSHPNIPVVMLSGERKRESIIKSIDMGAKDYILKPFTRELLFAKVERFCNKGRPPSQEVEFVGNLDTFFDIEVERAVRGKSPLSIICLNLNNYLDRENMTRMYHALSGQILRKIDSVLFYKSKMIIILPLTGIQGLEVVREKISKSFNDAAVDISRFPVQTLSFPDEIKERELIEGYRYGEIKDIILKKLDLQK